MFNLLYQVDLNWVQESMCIYSLTVCCLVNLSFFSRHAVVGYLLDQGQHDFHAAIREGTEEFDGNAITWQELPTETNTNDKQIPNQ